MVLDRIRALAWRRSDLHHDDRCRWRAAVPLDDSNMGFLSQPNPLRWSSSRIARVAAAALATLGLVAAILILYEFDPAEGHYPVCPFHYLTGLHCPGCGTLRALHQLLHGNVAAALSLNLLSTIAIPI